MTLINIKLLLAEAGRVPIIPSLEEMMWHLLNFVILTVGLYLLLFKPVKKMIAKRQESVKKIEEENASLNNEVKEMKVEFDKLLNEAKHEAAQIHHDAVEVASQKSNEIIHDARNRAREIVDRTEKDMVIERAKLESDIKNEISELSIQIATKIVGREITEKDNDKLIEEYIKIWSRND